MGLVKSIAIYNADQAATSSIVAATVVQSWLPNKLDQERVSSAIKALKQVIPTRGQWPGEYYVPTVPKPYGQTPAAQAAAINAAVQQIQAKLAELQRVVARAQVRAQTQGAAPPNPSNTGQQPQIPQSAPQPPPQPRSTPSGSQQKGGGGNKPPDPDASDSGTSGSDSQIVSSDLGQQPILTQGQPTTQPYPQGQGLNDSRLGDRPVGKTSFHVQQVIGYSDDRGGAARITGGGGVSRPDPSKGAGSGERGGGGQGDQGGSPGGDFGGGFGGGGNFSTNKNKTSDSNDANGTADPVDTGGGGDSSAGGNTGAPKSGDAPQGDPTGTISDDSTGFVVDGQTVNTGTTYKEFPDPDSGDGGEGGPRAYGRGRARPPSFQDPNRGLSRAKLRMLLAMARESGYQSGDDWGAGGYNPRFSSGSNADPETTGSSHGADPWANGGSGGSSDSGGPDFFSGGGTPTTSQWSYGPPLWSDSDDYWSDYNPHYRPLSNSSWGQTPTGLTTKPVSQQQQVLRSLPQSKLVRFK